MIKRKKPINPGPVLTSGEAARACHVSIKAVNKWCDKGLLKHHRLPFSGFRRVFRADLTAFMRLHGMPEEWAKELEAGSADQSP